MKAVIYTNDMIPITIVDLPYWAVEHIKKHRYLVLPEKPKFVNLRSLAPSEPIQSPQFRTAHISAEVLIRNGKEHVMLFTRDEEEALVVECAFLPGQTAAVREIRDKARIQGIFE